MKKIIVFIIFILIICSNAGFCSVKVQSTGGTTITPTQISTPILMTVTDIISLILTVRVKALDQYITNTTNPTYKIPVSQLYLKDTIGSEYRIMYNTYVTVADNISISIGNTSRSYTCIVKNIGILPRGHIRPVWNLTRIQLSLLQAQSIL